MNRIGDSQFFSQTPKLDLLQKQLDGDNLSQTLEALKRLIGMISKGKDASSMFPYVVKNVVSPSLEIKKLVYMFLIHYAEEKPDEALLSISHFQKDMTDKNQFIRASALRVLSSIRVPLIVQIVMIAIRKCAADSSPYVRKVAAIAIPKVFSMNEDEKDQLISIIETLLGDNNTIVLGAAMFAFNEVCPERYELLHKHFRKICKLLIDCDEWGQVLIVNVLLRYARTQFLSPFKEGYKKKTTFYDDKNSEHSASESEDLAEYDMDPDHRLLLRSSLPLLQSRNSSVVLAVATLYFHLAPSAEFSVVARALIRISRSNREQQFVILSNLSSMATERPEAFQTHFKAFFIYPTDPCFIRDLKLNILALLASESNVSTILREFKNYVKWSDKQLVKATIRAIGRVANSVPEVADPCMAELLLLINDKQEEVVAESVVIMRHLLQKQASDHPSIIKKLAKLLDTIKVPVARASVIWLVGEYFHLIPNIAPDVFRKLAVSFKDEEDVAKLQIITLGTKLYLNDFDDDNVRNRIADIFQYVLQQAKYDVKYDIRDRTRMIRSLVFSENNSPAMALLKERIKDILLCEKSAPEFHSRPQDHSRFQLNTISHLVNHTAIGYTVLPDFPEKQPDTSVREVKDSKYRREAYNSKDANSSRSGSSRSSRSRSFYSNSSRSYSRSRSGSSGSRSRTPSDASYSSRSRSRSRSASRSATPPPQRYKRQPRRSRSASPSMSRSRSRSNSSSRSVSKSRSRSRSLSDSPPRRYNKANTKEPPKSKPTSKSEKPKDQPKEDLLDEFFHPSSAPSLAEEDNIVKHTLLAPGKGKGLSIQYGYSKIPSVYPEHETVRLWFHNQSSQSISQVQIGKEDLPDGASLIPFQPISSLEANEQKQILMYIKSGKTNAPVKFEIWTTRDQFSVSLSTGSGNVDDVMMRNLTDLSLSK